MARVILAVLACLVAATFWFGGYALVDRSFPVYLNYAFAFSSGWLGRAVFDWILE